jgi:hypothetical protein
MLKLQEPTLGLAGLLPEADGGVIGWVKPSTTAPP